MRSPVTTGSFPRIKDVVKSRGYCNYTDLGNACAVIAIGSDAIGRLLCGFGLNHVKSRKIYILIGAPLVVAFGNALLCLNTPSVIYIGPILVGLANGTLWTLAPQLTGTFGMKH
eukprot:FR742585.1.p1 GENE.FR742585.1~~FR742585.1.p1  ORF type:complete len:114 (+),score=0.99 FR742585.1:125-466(+)